MPPPADDAAVRVQNKKEDYIIRHIVQEKIKNLKQILAMINDALEKAPEGGLKIKQRESKIYYYQQIRNDNKCVEHYLHKQDAGMIKQLADKGYYIKLKPLLEKELQLLEDFAHAYNEKVVDDIYDSMTEARKQLITPVRMSRTEILKEWKNEVYEVNQKYPENLIYKTENGELVRSKSELILANMLKHKETYLRYKYERPLELQIAGKVQIIYPDFTILNVTTGRIVYWEHAGRMDDPRYAMGFVKKVHTYMDNGIFPGEDLIITYETMNHPIATQHIQTLIETI